MSRNCRRVHCHLPLWTVSLIDSCLPTLLCCIHPLHFTVSPKATSHQAMDQHQILPKKRKASLSSFHPFSCLPAELRIQIWELAAFDRVLTIEMGCYDSCRKNIVSFQSPTPAPPVTQVCRESRRYSSYRKYWSSDRKLDGRYIWINPAHDVIYEPDLSGYFLERCAIIARLKISAQITRLRVRARRCDADDYFYMTCPLLACFPQLESLDVLVEQPAEWTHFPKRMRWADWDTRPYVRIVDYRTGEWIDEESCGVYKDWLETKWGRYISWYRVGSAYLEPLAERMRKVDGFKGLPRIGLEYW